MVQGLFQKMPILVLNKKKSKTFHGKYYFLSEIIIPVDKQQSSDFYVTTAYTL